MKTTLIAPDEVWEIAFPGSDYLSRENITPTQIEAAQLKYLKPALGKLYEALEESRYASLVAESLKAPLAWYVRSLVLEELSATTGSLGVAQPKSDYTTPLSPKQILSLRKQARNRADTLLDRAIETIEASPSTFPEYDSKQNIRHQLSTRGGIVLKKQEN